MNWSRFFPWLKKGNPIIGSNFDKRLMTRLKRSAWPRFSQFKYLPQFLNKQEKLALGISLLAVIISLLSWGTIFVVRHSTLGPKDGGEYNEALVGQPKYINPLFASANDVDADIASLIYSGLFHYDQTRKITPELAADYTISADGKNYDINLKTDIKWSDNEPLTADDVIYTIETIQNPEVGSPLFASFAGVTVTKISDSAVRFSLKEPFAPFLSTLTVGILPAHLWSNITPSNIRLAKFNLKPIGSGQWQFNKMVKDDAGNIQSYALSPNPSYFDIKPHLSLITFKFFDNYTDAIAAARSQTVEGVSFVPNDLRGKIENKNTAIYDFSLPQYTALFFNTQNNSALKDESTRLALAKTIDQPTLVAKIFDNNASPLVGPFLPNDPGYNPNLKNITYAPEDAAISLDKKWPRITPEEFFEIRRAQLLENYKTEIEAAKADTSTPDIVTSTLAHIDQEISQNIRAEMPADQTYYRKNDKKETLKITITTIDSPDYIKVAEYIAAAWRAIGVNANVRKLDTYQLNREAIHEHKYDAIIYGEVIGADPDLYAFWHSSQINYPGLNLSLFSDRQSDKLLEDARVITDLSKRLPMYQKFQEILNTEVPAIFLYNPKHLMAIDRSIKGVNIGNIVVPADRYLSIGNWYTKTTWHWKQ